MTLRSKLELAFPQLNFVAGNQFYWSPENNEIFYKPDADTEQAEWAFLHEAGHALLKHRSYKADFEILRLEVEAWEKARQIATHFAITIDEDHIQDCLDTYRDWLHKRSICPTCNNQCLQQDDHTHYSCFNCHTVWKVSASRFCRAYRSTKKVTQRPAPLQMA